MSYSDFFGIVRRLVLCLLVKMFYNIPGMPLTSLKELATYDDVITFVKASYDHENQIDLYIEHSGYDVLEMINDELNEDAKVYKSSSESDSSDDDEQVNPLDDLTKRVDFQTEGDENLDIPKITINDPWLIELAGHRNFIGYREYPKPLDERFNLEEDDPNEHLVDQKFKEEEVVRQSYHILTRHWLVFPSGFQEVEVRRGDEAYGVNLNTKNCVCKMWELSEIPCVHAVAAYMHMKMEPELGPLPLIEQKMPRRSRKEYQMEMDYEALAATEAEQETKEAEQAA
uniref:Zinc finger, PMZ-type n=1 Tax=Tanacetum cinerariifolium TaxID=118510 RepID=A0A6L2J625_TANCI|nr:zinc finger, PMZ-type [Tanacetum cinerariifolium]